MKKLCILPAFLFLSNLAWAQNWMPVNSTEKYNYSTGDHHYYATIWADSSALINNEPVYYLNKVLKKVADGLEPEWPDYSIAYYLENQSQFFLSKIICTSGGNIKMLENDSINYLIKPYANLNDIWVFDSLKNDTARVIDLSETLIFGISDSIKVIKLSGNDTIILSKNYGILKFPMFDTRHQHIKLLGIEGRNAGLVLPKFKDFYDFQVGDVFCYHYLHTRHAAYYIEDTKIKIKGKAVIGDSIIYLTRYMLRMNRMDLGIKDSAFINKDSTLIFIDSDSNFLNKYSNQILNSSLVSEKYKPVSVKKNFAIPGDLWTIIKSYPINPFGKKTDSDTIFEIRDLGIYIPEFDREESYSYGTGLGLLNHTLNSYGGGYSYTNKLELIGCVKNGTIHGNLLDDSFFMPGKKPGFTIYPNPVTDVITIKSLKNNSNSSFVIYNVNGAELLTDRITDKEVKVDIGDLRAGIYFIKLISDGSVEMKKIVKK